jgi:protein-disulfide isomerase
MKASTRRLLLAFSVLGLGAAATSTYVHYRLLTDPSYTSFCDVNTTVACTEAYLSQYGSFLGVPVAPIGMLYFAFVLLMIGMTRRPASAAHDSAPAYVFAVSTLALAFVLYLGWASYAVLKVFCVLCAITYVSVVAIFIISGGATALPMTKLPSRAVRDLRALVATPAALVTALLFAAAAVAVVVVFPREGLAQAASQEAPALPAVTDAERAKLAEWWDMQPKVDIPVPDNGAKVLIVKFNDYQCPACKATHDLYKSVLAKYTSTGQVRYIVKHYPLEAECNPNSNGNHFASCEAAAAVIMARGNGNAARMEDWIFANFGPPALTPQQVKQAAHDVAGIQDFDAQYQRALEEVKTDAGLGKLLDVKSTPTFFIAGRRLPQAIQPQYLDAIIDLELKRAK